MNPQRDFERKYIQILTQHRLTSEVMHSLSKNHDIITPFIVDQTPHLKWDYESLSYNPHFHWAYIKNHLDKPWNFTILSLNSSINLSIVQKYHQFPWNYTLLSRNKNITWEDVKNNRDQKWNFNNLSMNSNITWDIIQQNPAYPWNIDCFSRNPNVTRDVLLSNLQLPWNFRYLLANQNLFDILIEIKLKENYYDYQGHFSSKVTIDIVEKYPTVVWLWDVLSQNRNITWEHVIAHPEMNWYYTSLTKNPNITWEHISQKINENWDFSYLSLSHKVTFDIIREHPQLPWNIHNVHHNPNITKEIVAQHPEFEWNWKLLIMYNSNFTVLDAIEHGMELPPHILFQRMRLETFTIEDMIKHPTLPWDMNLFTKLSFVNDQQRIEQKNRQLISEHYQKVIHEFVLFYFHPSRVKHLYNHGLLLV